jgi:predicted enzyme related to lactoylglutathione lyase
MPERDGYIPGVPCWVDTSQPDPEAAVDFYTGVFGWEFENMLPADSPGKYFIARLRGGDVAAVGSIPEAMPETAMWNTYVWVASADDTAAKVTDAGGNVVMDPFDVMDSGRMAVFADPEGATCCIWQAKEHRGARIVNEHGALNFNGLHTRDVDGEKSFYGSVFGWTTLDIDAGEMWTLPGYGDHLERDTPGLRKQIAEVGGPPAFDAPWSRVAVIGDPQGATFIASQFVPENRDVGS